jgi:hypothetical protein
MDTDKMNQTGAAITPTGCKETEINNPALKDGVLNPSARISYRPMQWPVNYSLYAAATMFTLFFAGNIFAPKVKIEGESAQDFLQNRYLAAFKHCFTRLKDCKAITSWGIMNEPHPGFIGYGDLRRLENAALALGPVPSPFNSMLAASGHCIKAPVYTPWLKGWRVTGSRTINPHGVSLFREGYTCPWKRSGVWTDEGGLPKLLTPDYFSKHMGRPIRFTDDFLKPFIIRFIKEMEKPEKPVLFFIEGIPHGENLNWNSGEPRNVVNAFHHYDGFTLFTKNFRPYFTVDPQTGKVITGRKRTAAHYSAKLAEAKAWAKEKMGDMPCFLGEFGLPFDLNHKKAYKSGDYSQHENALRIYYDAIDENLLGSAIWNYTADNNHEEGDHWNGEDLSIVSLGAKASGRKLSPRAEAGWLRPYPMATAGIPNEFSYDSKQNDFFFRFIADSSVKAPTEIFIPDRFCPEEIFAPGYDLLIFKFIREEQKLLIYNEGYSGKVEIKVSLSSPKA